MPVLFGPSVAETSLDDRGITVQFSGGDCEMRPKQEILLGIGSCQAIEVLGLEPSIANRGEDYSWRRRVAAALERVL